MILSSQEICRRLQNNGEKDSLIIRPYSGECLQPASYDLRIADKTLLSRGVCTLVSSLEWIQLPVDLAATIRCRSSFGRRGILITGGFVDPGFRGQLTLCLTNLGDNEIVLNENDRVVQLILQEVSSGVRGYEGRYQDSTGVVRAR
jgi:dCTP deaminase